MHESWPKPSETTQETPVVGRAVTYDPLPIWLPNPGRWEAPKQRSFWGSIGSFFEGCYVVAKWVIIVSVVLAVLGGIAGWFDSSSPSEGSAGSTGSTRALTASPYWNDAVSHCSNSAEAAALGISQNGCIAMFITLAEN